MLDGLEHVQYVKQMYVSTFALKELPLVHVQILRDNQLVQK